jgi:hypothetical protein
MGVKVVDKNKGVSAGDYCSYIRKWMPGLKRCTTIFRFICKMTSCTSKMGCGQAERAGE